MLDVRERRDIPQPRGGPVSCVNDRVMGPTLLPSHPRAVTSLQKEVAK